MWLLRLRLQFFLRLLIISFFKRSKYTNPMAVDNSVVKPVEAPPLAPLKLKSRLASTPKAAPKYSVKVKNLAGADVTLADPRATRALVALMDVHAVVGGAACHWGGPAAFAEMNAAVHGIMFATQG